MRFLTALLPARKAASPDRAFDVLVFHDHVNYGQTVSRFYFMEALAEDGWRNHVLPALVRLPGIVCDPESLEPHQHFITVQWAMNPLRHLGYEPLEGIDLIERSTVQAIADCFGWRHTLRLERVYSDTAVIELGRELDVAWGDAATNPQR